EPLEPGNLPVEVPARLAEVLQLRLQRSALHLEPGAPAILDDVADAEIVVLRDLDALNGLSTSLAPSRARRVVLRVVYLFRSSGAARLLRPDDGAGIHSAFPPCRQVRVRLYACFRSISAHRSIPMASARAMHRITTSASSVGNPSGLPSSRTVTAISPSRTHSSASDTSE